jgi:hypothetical protein
MKKCFLILNNIDEIFIIERFEISGNSIILKAEISFFNLISNYFNLHQNQNFITKKDISVASTEFLVNFYGCFTERIEFLCDNFFELSICVDHYELDRDSKMYTFLNREEKLKKILN